VLRIGVTDAGDGESVLEVQDVFTLSVSQLRERSRATLPAAFGPTVTEDA
jgi:phosphoribosylformylglycinamidine synthase